MLFDRFITVDILFRPRYYLKVASKEQETVLK